MNEKISIWIENFPAIRKMNKEYIPYYVWVAALWKMFEKLYP